MKENKALSRQNVQVLKERDEARKMCDSMMKQHAKMWEEWSKKKAW